MTEKNERFSFQKTKINNLERRADGKEEMN